MLGGDTSPTPTMVLTAFVRRYNEKGVVVLAWPTHARGSIITFCFEIASYTHNNVIDNTEKSFL